MRINISSGTLVAFVFLAVAAVSHAIVYWIPVWKTTSVLRYHPKHGWKPVSTGWKPKKPFFRLPKHNGWKPKHKKCHLCHALKPYRRRQHHNHHFDAPKSFHAPKDFLHRGGFDGFGGFGGGFGGKGFGGGKKGHGWGGWDW